MSTADNKALVRRYFEEVWNRGRSEAIDEMCSATGVVHGLAGQTTSGVAELKAFHAAYWSAFPDQRLHIDEVIAEGDLVMVRWSRTQTHTGHGLTFGPTGKPLAFSGVSIMRVADGKLVEGWNYYDRLDMLHQLGQLPPTAAF